MSRRTIAALCAAALLIIIIIVIWIVQSADPIGDTVTVERGSIDVTIDTVGRIDVRDEVVLRSPLTTSAEIVAVEIGDEVQQDDVLMQLDRTPFQEQVDAAEAALFEAETALSVLGSSDTSDAADLAERVAAQQRVQAAENALEVAEAAIADSLVLAPFDGTILSVAIEDGDDVGQNAELLHIAELESFEIIVEIDEVDLPLISRGSQVRIVLEAYPEQEITSTVHSIARRGQLVAGTTVFPAVVRFEAVDDLLILPGMNADVEITTEVRENVLLLPERALQTVGRRTFVDVVVDGDVERREIRTGVRSAGQVEIAAGLDEGDRIVLP